MGRTFRKEERRKHQRQWKQVKRQRRSDREKENEDGASFMDKLDRQASRSRRP